MNRRGSDPLDADFSEARTGNGITVGYGKAQLRAGGALGIIAFLAMGMLMLSAYVTYAGFRDLRDLQKEANKGHNVIATSQDITACIVSLPPEDRVRTRTMRHREDFLALCPWLRGL